MDFSFLPTCLIFKNFLQTQIAPSKTQKKEMQQQSSNIPETTSSKRPNDEDEQQVPEIQKKESVQEISKVPETTSSKRPNDKDLQLPQTFQAMVQEVLSCTNMSDCDVQNYDYLINQMMSVQNYLVSLNQRPSMTGKFPGREGACSKKVCSPKPKEGPASRKKK